MKPHRQKNRPLSIALKFGGLTIGHVHGGAELGALLTVVAVVWAVLANVLQRAGRDANASSHAPWSPPASSPSPVFLPSSKAA